MKTVTLKVRVTPEQQAAWNKAALQAGAASLSDFIREVIDGEVKYAGITFEDAKSFLDSLSDGGVVQPVERGSETPDVAGSSPAPAIEYDFDPSKIVCPRKFTHVMGVYCTACGTTPA